MTKINQLLKNMKHNINKYIIILIETEMFTIIE